jgi:hypothetical protein
MAPIAAPGTRFSDLGIGVIDFTADVMAPEVWLHNGDRPWRIASTGKIAILLAAVQLRDDVRRVKATGLISPEQFDDLFAMRALWAKSGISRIQEIAGKERAPRISTIFDINAASPDFFGARALTPADKSAIVARLPGAPLNPHLTWAVARSFSVWERLWLTGALSDNVAATTCVSEIGVAYMKAVQRAYGLFDPGNGMHLLRAGAYGGVVRTLVFANPNSPRYRPLQNKETNINTFAKIS